MQIGDIIKTKYDVDGYMRLVITYRVTSLRGDGTFGVQVIDSRVEPKALPKHVSHFKHVSPGVSSFDEFCERVDAARGTVRWVHARGRALSVSWIDERELKVWTGSHELATATATRDQLSVFWTRCPWSSIIAANQSPRLFDDESPKPAPGSFNEFCDRIEAARGTAAWVFAPGKQIAVAWAGDEWQVWTGSRDGLKTVASASVSLHALWVRAKSARIEDMPGFRPASDPPSTVDTVTARVGTAERNAPVRAWYNRTLNTWHDAASGKLIRVPVVGWFGPPRFGERYAQRRLSAALARGMTLRKTGPHGVSTLSADGSRFEYRRAVLVGIIVSSLSISEAEALVREGGWEVAR